MNAENRAETRRDEVDDAPVLLSTRRADDQVDMTPMVDVTFLLLIFFMITAAFALQKSLEVPAAAPSPSASAPTVDELEQDAVVIRVDGDNVYWIGSPQWSAEQRAASIPEMMAQLRAARRANDALNRLLVEASGDATHERVVAALDAGVGAGMEEIRLLSYEEGDL